jgi:predicted pyridoxine 5'-phosphate oxidase superfamily flavin-nucleotide-binding protein
MPGVLDDDMKRVVREQRLGYVATVCADGTPNLSPKGTTAVWDDDHLVFLDIFSPGTVANIEAGRPVVEVNVVDPIRRKGYRFKGPAEVLRDGTRFEDVMRWYERERGSDVSRVNSVVLIRVDDAAALVSPAYADGSSEDTIEQRSLDMYGLMRRA